MSETITIELREEEATLNNDNGDFQVNLKEPIPIYPNDVVQIRNVFVDSVEADDSAVVVDEDTVVSVEFAAYFQNWGALGSLTPPDVTRRPTPITNDLQFDTDPYFACETAFVPVMANVICVPEFKLFRKKDFSGAWGRPADQKPLILNFEYRGANNADKLITLNIHVPHQSGASDVLIVNSKTNPKEFPLFVNATMADLTNPLANPFRLLNTEDILPTDNIDTRVVIEGNTAPPLPPVAGQRLTWNGAYSGTDFRSAQTWRFKKTGGQTFGNGAQLTFQYQNWKTGIVENRQITINQSATGTEATFTFTPNIDYVQGGMGTAGQREGGAIDPTGSIKYVAPTPLFDSSPINASPFNILTQDEDGSSNFFLESFTTVQAEVDFFVAIKTFTETLTIPKGKYPLAQLCEKLTDGFTSLTLNGNQNFDSFPTNNQFLQTVRQLRASNNLSNLDPQYFLRADGKSIMDYSDAIGATTDPFFGTDQVAFIADPQLNKVKLSAIHQNLLSTTGTAICKYVEKGAENQGPGGGQGSQMIGRNGGIVFTGMQPQSFWESLGFVYTEDEKIFVNFGSASTTIAGTHYMTQSIPTDLGRFTTTSLSGLNNAILKASPYVFTGLNALNGSDGGTANANFEIIAPNSVAQSSDGDGYFMIEVKGIPTTKTIGTNLNSNTISAIISRYNTIGSYTSAYGEGSTPVQYKGEPHMIGTFSVRILAPNGELSNDIENKSSVFLEITRSNQPSA